MHPQPASDTAPSMPTGAANHRLLMISLIVGLLAGILFTPGLPGEFLFDDVPNIVNNSSIHLTELNAAALIDVLATPQASGALRGLPTLTFALDYWRAGGADPAAFKITNIVIHALTAFALVWLFRSLLVFARVPARRVMWIAAALALAWAIHPLQVSSVLYAVQRLQTMGTLFLVLAMIAYLQARQAQIEGRSGRAGLMVTVLLWALALGCKEDSILLPAYLLALELTVLRYAAADARMTTVLRRTYLIATLVGVAAYLLWVIPAFWQWDAYPGRDFNSLERLLTQARVLCLYLWQIIVPLPQHMPFHYDWIEPSRSLLQPWTTMPALVLITMLLVLAWRVRHSWSLFSLGVFVFFSAHFIASNVVGLELAYEHRNHFALIGALLAVGSVLARAGTLMRIRPVPQAALGAAALVVLGGATALRAHDWRSGVTLAQASTVAAPGSPRAWIDLCSGTFRAGGGVSRDNPNLDAAIQACSSGADASTESLNNLALLVVLKTLRGDVVTGDWQRFQQRLATVRMSWDNIRAPLIFNHYAGLGVELDTAQILAALAVLEQRATLRPATLVYIGQSLMNDMGQPESAVAYYIKAVEALPPGDAFAWQIAAELRANGYPTQADAIERAGSEQLEVTRPTQEEQLQ